MRCNMEDAYALKHLFENVFGRSAWYELKSSKDLNKWKNYCARLLSAINVSAKASILIADSEWFDELASEIELGKDMLNLSEDFEQLFANLSASLGTISFLQLGMVPSRSNKKKVTLRHPSNWQLNSYRSVQYVQNTEQRKNSHNKKINKD